jgi:hypothetical protein
MKKLKVCASVVGVVVATLLSAGCASEMARTQLEKVAKGWCETIRASQVIPVYPLTEDLQVGDVFLVRVPISEQANEYKSRGFLPLDDALVRLKYTNFSDVYFNAYWTNGYGLTPHAEPYYTNDATYTNLLTDAALPRAAFPSYSFSAQSGFGLNLALPIEGIPVALSYLNSQEVDGSVTISDARTYAGDFGGLLRLLKDWTDANKDFLKQTAASAAPTTVYLRVVSRVYYARAIDVALHRSGSQGGGGKAGVVNDVSLITNSNALQNYTNLLGALNTMQSSITSAAQAGGAVKFVAASDSTIGLSQSFDRLLAVGYLGFDVPINSNGDIGSPVPTFLRIKQEVPSLSSSSFAPATAVPISPDIQSRKVALEKALAKLDDAKARQILNTLGTPSSQNPTVALQNRILDAWSASDVKALEDAFKTAQPNAP